MLMGGFLPYLVLRRKVLIPFASDLTPSVLESAFQLMQVGIKTARLLWLHGCGLLQSTV